jgi:AcrR family transcriptional regulator
MLTERPRLSADVRRAGILAAARHEFARKGFKGAGTAEIAARAGCSEPTLYKHFESKQALFAAVLEDAGRRMGERVESIVSGAEDPIGAWLQHIAEQASTDPEIAELVRLRMLAVSLVDDPAVHAALRRSTTEMRRRMGRILARARDRGQVREDVDLDAVAWLWFGFTLAGGFAHALDDSLAADMCPRMARTFVDLLRPMVSEAEEGT